MECMERCGLRATKFPCRQNEPVPNLRWRAMSGAPTLRPVGKVFRAAQVFFPSVLVAPPPPKPRFGRQAILKQKLQERAYLHDLDYQQHRALLDRDSEKSALFEEIGDDFVEVGMIYSTHGVSGEVKVLSRTDFPEQRLQQPGTRWLGFRQMDKFVNVRKVQLTGGRKIILSKGPSWLLRFRGFNTVEMANQLIGAAVLVRAEDRPELEEGQFYIPDLIGLSVVMKNSGEVIGSIVDIFNTGANDLLRVKLSSSKEDLSYERKKETIERLVWVPFVEEIVPTIDLKEGRVEIVPPNGLLELNGPSQRPLKRELRKQALRTRRKLQGQIAGIKKRVLALNQGHILSGLALGDHIQKATLKEQLIGIDFKSFDCALITAFGSSILDINDKNRIFLPHEVHNVDWKGLDAWITVSSGCDLSWDERVDKETWTQWQAGMEVVSEGRVAIVTLPNEDDSLNDIDVLKSSFQFQAEELLGLKCAAELLNGERPLLPWIVVMSKISGENVEKLFRDEGFFGHDEEQVFFVKASCLPCVSSDAKEGHHKILMESKWRIFTGTAGEGQMLFDLDDSGVLSYLSEMGVEYIHVCAVGNLAGKKSEPVILGYMEDKQANIGLKVTNKPLKGEHKILCLYDSSPEMNIRASDDAHGENGNKVSTLLNRHYHVLSSRLFGASCEEFRMTPLNSYTFTIEYLKELSQQRYKFQYEAVPRILCDHVDEEIGQRLEVGWGKFNAFQLRCPIHSSLIFCSPLKVTVLKAEQFAV